jgi:hypothetical protein
MRDIRQDTCLQTAFYAAYCLPAACLLPNFNVLPSCLPAYYWPLGQVASSQDPAKKYYDFEEVTKRGVRDGSAGAAVGGV